MIVGLAVLELAFDPFLRVLGVSIPWRAIAVAGSVAVALLVAAVMARRREWVSQPEDLLYIAIGALPGAVVLGRLVHGLTYLDFYRRDPMALLDPARGSLSLLGVVIGGAATGAYVAWTLGVPVRRGADLAAVPVLLSIGLGKLSQLLAGAGQGSRFDGPWAVSFSGPGPWMSVSPDVPAHPSQAYEGLWALSAVPILLLLVARAGRRGTGSSGAGGSVFLFAVAWWLVGRIAAGFTWRDDRVVGPLNAEQALAVAVLAVTVLALSVTGLVRLFGDRRTPERESTLDRGSLEPAPAAHAGSSESGPAADVSSEPAGAPATDAESSKPAPRPAADASSEPGRAPAADRRDDPAAVDLPRGERR